VLIVGGGISGLSAAWFLHRKGKAVCVLEAAERVGGVISTGRDGGFLLERGPNSTLQRAGAEGGALARLVEQTGLSSRLIHASRVSDRRYIIRNGQLVDLPGGPVAFVRSPLLSWAAKLRLMGEPFIRRGEGEETIARFVERRLGREMLDYVIDPFVSGVYAGDVEKLSVGAAVPRVRALEQKYGSLVRGAIAMRRLGKGAAGPAGGLISFDDGMAVLPETIAARLPGGSCRIGCQAVALERAGTGWTVHWRDRQTSGSEQADRLVLSVPAAAAAELLEPLSPAAPDLLRRLPYAPVVTVGQAYARDQVRHRLDGFGFLRPRKEGLTILGALFSSSLFPGRAPEGKVLITSFVGGAAQPEALEMMDEELIARVHGDLDKVLGIDGEPEVVGITRYARAIPQYNLGHTDLIARLDDERSKLPGLHFRASWRDGVSVADCVTAGERLAEDIG
jgi:oxygen-dependent protoporphyrinogen oxidase